MVDKRIDKLLNLRMNIENDLTYEDVLQKTLEDGLTMFHPFFGMFLKDRTYKNVKYDEENKTIRLIKKNDKEDISTLEEKKK